MIAPILLVLLRKEWKSQTVGIATGAELTAKRLKFRAQRKLHPALHAVLFTGHFREVESSSIVEQ